jgi:hypothetical protein
MTTPIENCITNTGRIAIPDCPFLPKAALPEDPAPERLWNCQ